MLVDFMTLPHYDIEKEVEKFHNDRMRRLMLVAMGRSLEQTIKSKPCMKALDFAEQLADSKDTASMAKARYAHAKSVENAIRATGHLPGHYVTTARAQARGIVELAIAEVVRFKGVFAAFNYCYNLPTNHGLSFRAIFNCTSQQRQYGFWNSTLASIATEIYEKKNFKEMGVLADALEDFEPDRKEAIEHCRSPIPHHRGCWVLDSIMNR